MSGDWDEDLCKKALMLVEELCFNSPRGHSQSELCQEFSYLLRGRNRQLDAGKESGPDGTKRNWDFTGQVQLILTPMQ